MAHGGGTIAHVRIPLAVKVMLAFVAVIAAGALPVQLGLRGGISAALQHSAMDDLGQRVTLLSERLRNLDTESLRETARDAARVIPERITLVATNGTVLFDSTVDGPWDNHATRPEVAAALEGRLGTAARVSASDGMEYAYAAAPITGPRGVMGVVRLATAARASEPLLEQTAVAIDRGLAGSISLALVLSFVAVLFIVRPLRRMRDAASRLAAGELTVTVDVRTKDELEELARGLEVVGARLRARLATAGSGETLLGQLVHAMVQGVVVLGPDGRVHHINGVARAQLGLRGPQESQRVMHLVESPEVQRAVAAATSDPLGVDIRVPHPVTGEPTDGTVVALRRPDGDPLIALILDVTSQGMATLTEVPDPREVVGLPFREMMDRALARVAEDLEDSNASFVMPDEWPATTVVDVGGRVESVIAETLRAAARAPGVQPNTPITAAVHDGAVCLSLPVALPPDVVRSLEPKLAPLGGRVEGGGGNVQLWLPKA